MIVCEQNILNRNVQSIFNYLRTCNHLPIQNTTNMVGGMFCTEVNLQDIPSDLNNITGNAK